jgi:Methyltransferase domain
MALGPLIRRFLGPRLARRAGEHYRAIYVDLAKVAAALAAVIPRDAQVLDVGGGDGQPLNHLLAIRPDLTITTLDPAPMVGQWIDSRYEGQVKRLPRTSLAEFVACPQEHPDVILIADVMHHIPKSARRKFLDSVGILLDSVPGLRIIVKDVEPGHLRALLGFWSDRYVTGDRNVRLISRDGVTRLFEEVLGPLHREDTDLFKRDCPNYAIVFRR